MVITNAQLIGISEFQNQDDPNRGSKTLHFLYKAAFIEGTGTISFTVFKNERSIDLSIAELNSNYRLSYYKDRDKGYLHLVDIQKVTK